MILYIWDEINIPIQKKNLLNIWNTFSLFKQSLPQLTKNNVTEKKNLLPHLFIKPEKYLLFKSNS